MKDWKADEIDVDYLLESGLLFEINRTILHLFGMAITVKITNGEKSWSFKDLRETPEDAVFEPDKFKAGQKKLKKFIELWGQQQMYRRQHCLGASCQSQPDIRKPQNAKRAN